jgi:hypothetical protein
LNNIPERKEAEKTFRDREDAARRRAKERAVIAGMGRMIGSTLDLEVIYERFAQEKSRSSLAGFPLISSTPKGLDIGRINRRKDEAWLLKRAMPESFGSDEYRQTDLRKRG